MPHARTDAPPPRRKRPAPRRPVHDTPPNAPPPTYGPGRISTPTSTLDQVLSYGAGPLDLPAGKIDLPHVSHAPPPLIPPVVTPQAHGRHRGATPAEIAHAQAAVDAADAQAAKTLPHWALHGAHQAAVVDSFLPLAAVTPISGNPLQRLLDAINSLPAQQRDKVFANLPGVDPGVRDALDAIHSINQPHGFLENVGHNILPDALRTPQGIFLGTYELGRAAAQALPSVGVGPQGVDVQSGDPTALEQAANEMVAPFQHPSQFVQEHPFQALLSLSGLGRAAGAAAGAGARTGIAGERAAAALSGRAPRELVSPEPAAVAGTDATPVFRTINEGTYSRNATEQLVQRLRDAAASHSTPLFDRRIKRQGQQSIRLRQALKNENTRARINPVAEASRSASPEERTAAIYAGGPSGQGLRPSDLVTHYQDEVARLQEELHAATGTHRGQVKRNLHYAQGALDSWRGIYEKLGDNITPHMQALQQAVQDAVAGREQELADLGLLDPEQMAAARQQPQDIILGPSHVPEVATHYQGAFARQLNDQLRAGRDHPEVTNMDQAIAGNARSNPGVLYRGIPARFLEEQIGGPPTVGAEITDPAFSSASDRIGVAQHYATTHDRGYVLHISGGRALPTHNGEGEWIFPRGTTLRVTRVDGRNVHVSIEGGASPLYVPHRPIQRGRERVMPRRSTSILAAREGTIHGRTGHLLKTGNLDLSMRPVIERLAQPGDAAAAAHFLNDIRAKHGVHVSPGDAFDPSREQLISATTNAEAAMTDGYDVLRANIPKQHSAGVVPEGDWMLVPKPLWDERIAHFAPQQQGSLDRFGHELTNAFRWYALSARPAWLASNIVGNTAQALLGGVGPVSAYRAIDKTKGIGKHLPGRDYGDVIPATVPYGGMVTQMLAPRRGLLPRSDRLPQNPLRAANVTTENWARRALYLRHAIPEYGRDIESLVSAKTAEERAPRVVKIVDRFLGQFGHGKGRYVALVPFLGWLTFITKHTLIDLPIHHPARALLLARLGDLGNAGADYEGLLNSSLQGAIPAGEGDQGPVGPTTNFVRTGALNPWATITQLANFDPREPTGQPNFAGAVGAINPFGQIAYAAATGHELDAPQFTGPTTLSPEDRGAYILGQLLGTVPFTRVIDPRLRIGQPPAAQPQQPTPSLLQRLLGYNLVGVTPADTQLMNIKNTRGLIQNVKDQARR